MDEPMSPGVRFCDLGPLAIERAGVLEPIRGRLITGLLGLLLVRANQHVSTEALVDAVWDGKQSEGATLDSHVLRLRRLLEPGRRRGEPFSTILHNGSGFRLAVMDEQVDSLLFAQLAGEVRDLLITDQSDRALARCDEALALWRGEPWSPHTDDDWAVAAVARIREIRDQVREHRLECLLQLGDAETALADVEPLLAEAPLRERRWALCMLAAYRVGGADQALDGYRRARRVLVEEAGIEPGAELRELHARILDRDSSLDQPSKRAIPRERMPSVEVRLPNRRNELLGRATELQQLVQLVVTARLVTVVGSAGCGKTRLSIEVARTAARAFPDGVWFIDLSVAEDAGQLLDVITSSLEMAAPEMGSVVDALRGFTRNRRMLIVLDNCEHLLDEVAELADTLLGTHTELTLLTTSRVPLDLDDEHVWTLEPLPTRATTEMSLVDTPAVQLFLQRLSAAAPQMGHDSRQVELAAEICAGVDGLPLAIELAAGQARSFTLDEIAERVRTDLAGLARIGRGGSRHHATLRGAIDLSTATLDPIALTVHQAVAAVPGPFTVALAAQLADLPPGQAATALATLVHRSLLTPLGTARPGVPSRFSQLATVRAHGLGAAAELREVAQRRRNHWVARLISEIPPVGDPAELGWYAKLDDNYAAIRATLQHCLVEEPDPIGAAVAARLGLYWNYRGMAVEWRRWTTLGRRCDAAEPYDLLLLGASVAGIVGLTGGENLHRAWLDELDAYPLPLSYEQTVWLAQYLPAVCLTAWLSGATDDSHRAARELRRLADQTGHPLLDLFAAVTDVLARSQIADPTVLSAIEDCYVQAQAADNFYARWATALAGVAAGLTAGSPGAGLRWSDLQMREFAKLGFVVNVPALEARGTLLAMAGQPYDAIHTLARSRALARRSGLRWPSMPSTPDVLAAAESQLSRADIDRAYRDGTLSPAAQQQR